MGFKLSDRELDAMDGLPHFHRCVYIFGIRKHMDFETGVVGIGKKEVSYKGISEEVYVKPHKGVSNTGSNSREQVKRALVLLEKKGLIARNSIVTKDDKRLIIKCLLADTDNSNQNKAAPYPPWSPNDKAAPQAAPVLSNTKNTEKHNKNSIEIPGAQSPAESKSRPTTIQGGLGDENQKGDRHPVSGTLHNITLPSANDFLQLLAKQGYYVNQLHSNKSTLAMIQAWVKAEVGLEQAQIGINHVNGQLGGRPDTPSYYLKPVLQVRKDFEKAQQQAQEINNAKPQQSTHTTQSRYPKSATKQFWENQADIMRELAEDEN